MRKSVLKNFANFTGKYLCWSLLLLKLAKTPTQVFSCEICEILKNTYLTQDVHSRTYANDYTVYIVTITLNI